MNTWNWMEAIRDKIKDLAPSQIVMVGTHNSGSFTTDMTVCGRNQWNNIGDQLRDGVRALDIRVMKSFGGLYMHHSGLTSPRQSYIEALSQVGEFVNSNPYEVVILFLATGYNSNITSDEGKQEVRQALLDALRGRLVPYDPANIPTFGQLWDHGKNVIVVADSDLGRGTGADEALFWPSSVYSGTWGYEQSDPDKSLEEKIKWVYEHVTAALPNRTSQFFNADCAIWTYDIMRWAASDVNPRVVNWLQEWAADPTTRGGLNMIGIDNAHSGDLEVVRAVLNLYSDGILPVSNQPTRAARNDGASLRSASESIFSDAAARKHLADRGVSWHDCLREWKGAGELSEATLAGLEQSGVSRDLVRAFLGHRSKALSRAA